MLRGGGAGAERTTAPLVGDAGEQFAAPFQLFDLAADLAETSDVAAAHPTWSPS